MSGSSVPAKGRLAHQVLVYAADEELVSAAVPFVRNGLAAGYTAVLVNTPSKLALLSDALGPDAAAVAFHDAAEFYSHPMRNLSGLVDFVAGHEGMVLTVAELPESATRPDQTEWARFESLVDHVLSEYPARLLCPYDLRVVEPEAIARARRTHPLVRRGTELAPSDEYVDPAEFNRLCDELPLAPPAEPTLSLRFTSPAELRGLRRFLGECARQAGLTGDQQATLLVAANEVATNALRHGGGEGLVRTWVDATTFVCEVADCGRGIAEPLPGHTPPELDRRGGRGLWMVRQLCDLVEVRTNGAGGTGPGATVRLSLALAR